MKHIILIGYRCTGKTSVGKKLAKELKLPFYDTDVIIIDRIGKTIREWVEEKGWTSFRQIEQAVIREVSSLTSAVIALGGGAVLDPENREILKGKGLIVWLMADAQTIIARMMEDLLTEDQRPPLSENDREKEIRETLDKRIPIYASLADFRVDTEGKTIEVIIKEICDMMRMLGLII